VQDDLTRINGIGKTFAERLNSAGIHTFAELANLTPEHIRNVTAMRPWQADPDDWIVQAAILATS
jgi:large subunit ribosomal protein L21